MKSFLTIFAFTLVTCSMALAADKGPSAQAADPKMQEMMKKMTEAGTPGAEHKVLTDLAGDWKVSSKMWETAKGKPQESSGTSSFTPILGGRFVQQMFKGEVMGMPYEGMGLMGYDNVAKKYDTLWVDSMSTGMMKGAGAFDAKAKVLKEGGTYSCPITESRVREYRNEIKMVDKNKMVLSMYGKGLDGSPEFKQMELTYVRK
ncbi:MAG: DUF1579 domain-containing protein [Bdellovibrionota bacterium]